MEKQWTENLLKDLEWTDLEDVPRDFLQTIRFLARLKGELPHDVITHRYFFEKTYEDIAQSLEVSVDMVKKIIEETLETIRTEYADVARVGLHKYCEGMPMTYYSDDYRKGYFDALEELKEEFTFRKEMASFNVDVALENNDAPSVKDTFNKSVMTVAEDETAKFIENKKKQLPNSQSGIIGIGGEVAEEAKETVTV